MFQSTNSFQQPAPNGGPQEQRNQFQHSHSHSVQYNGSPFSVAGMNTMTNLNQSTTSPNVRGGSMGMNMGSSLGMGSQLGDSLSQSRSHYQSGYLMSSPPGLRDDPPLVATKAKMNHSFTGRPGSDFGMDSMFESSRQRTRQNMDDEDAPPMVSVNDIVNEVPEPSRFSKRSSVAASQSRTSLFRSAQPTTPKPAPSTQHNTTPLQIVVFGYPQDKYSVTVEYFRSLGECTDVEQSAEVLNCFRIGYYNAASALRAIRKNGEILGGSWMVGAKWADAAQAEALIGSQLVRGSLSSPDFGASSPEHGTPSPGPSVSFAPSNSRMSVDDFDMHSAPSTPTVGTPIKLAPSTSAFRRPGAGAPAAIPAPTALLPAVPPGGAQMSPSKGMLGQVSDLIFGW
ncbi:uncharacterized protein BXZ73DRAFT_89385 [Epithele typhae]|uniref:uncharacterized protein n=1 Tax=Epithele typhae TaxID=378194 RepID=UPI0020084F3C|nr:uncharacterized protein BXZ73DRAFT_89385 [Epithele typhae]KAH9935889.1 hypothetical protein BXZ73DRAFT_89385 [Epithele typhae]